MKSLTLKELATSKSLKIFLHLMDTKFCSKLNDNALHI